MQSNSRTSLNDTVALIQVTARHRHDCCTRPQWIDRSTIAERTKSRLMRLRSCVRMPDDEHQNAHASAERRVSGTSLLRQITMTIADRQRSTLQGRSPVLFTGEHADLDNECEWPQRSRAIWHRARNANTIREWPNTAMARPTAVVHDYRNANCATGHAYIVHLTATLFVKHGIRC